MGANRGGMRTRPLAGRRRVTAHFPPDHSTTASSNQRSAWDRPPPIASPLDMWRPRQMHSRTPQHLLSLSVRDNGLAKQTWSAPPLLLRDRFLAAPTATGSIYIWDLVRILCPSQERESDNHLVYSSSSFPPQSSQTLQGEVEGNNNAPPASVATATTAATSTATSEPEPIRNYYAQAASPLYNFNGIEDTFGVLDPFDVPTVSNNPDLVVDIKPTATQDGSQVPCSLVALTSVLDSSFLLEKKDEDDPGPIILVGLSVTGIVHVVLLEEHSPNTNSIDSSPSIRCRHDTKLRIEFQYSWSTGSMGAMECLTVTRDGLIIIGYDSGRLEAWKLEKETKVSSTDNGVPLAATGKKTPRKTGGDGIATAASPVSGTHDKAVRDCTVVYKERLVWCASFEFAPSIRSVVELNVHQRGSNDEALPRTNDSNDSLTTCYSNCYLILTLQQETRSASASMIEVVNVSTLVEAWKEAHVDKEINPSVIAVSLDNHCILPEPGMEIVNSITLPHHDGHPDNALPRPTWIPSRGTGSLCLITSSTDVSCAAALADGSILLLSTSSSSDGQLKWGIQRPENQLLFSHPAVGIGMLSCTATETADHGQKLPVPHVVCCLRGGTAYLIPVTHQQGTMPPVVSVVSYPHDIESDIDFHRIQHFAAGNIVLERPGQCCGQESIPVLLYAWPGGIIDVYAADLLPYMSEGPLLRELVSNGSVELLRNHLASSNTITPEWAAARNEVNSWPRARPFSVQDLMSRQLDAFRLILLSMKDSDL